MKINLKNAKVIKSLKGFGGSACWWSPQIKDEKIRDDVANLLYGDSGLKMNIYRFNVGGGYEKNNLRIDNPWRYVESFMLGDGTFDYSKDKYAVFMMKKCLALWLVCNICRLQTFSCCSPFLALHFFVL